MPNQTAKAGRIVVKPGAVISHYEILDELGRGGMGVVYKAADTKLNRTVALKVLPPHAIGSSDDRARFYREARAAAALHHPNIATIFEIDEDEGQPFIAMEYVDGQALDDRISERPLPLKQAVDIAIQIAEALKAAHAKNIVHRDVKSANVMLTSGGNAKVLDFGLAKTAASTKLTQMGSTLGTVAYMSPQQALGEDVDHRTDLWSLGAVLYEMIAGKLPFPGDFEQAVVYAILNQEPQPLTAVRTGVPMGLEWIVTKLLAKNPDERYQSTTDLLVDLRTVDLTAAGMSRNRVSAAGAALQSEESKSAEGGLSVPAWVTAGFLLGVITMGLIWLSSGRSEVVEATVETSVKRFRVPLHAAGGLSGVDISPDGSKIVYADLANTVDNVHVLDLATGETRTIDGSAGTVLVSVSPDGQWILLTESVSIERVSMFSGTPLPVVTTEEGTPRADWGPGNWIVYENQQAIWRASTETNEAMPFTVKDSAAGEVDHDWPRLLPDGRTVMATIEYANKPSTIGFWDFETGERKGQIPLPGYRARYVSTGHIMLVLGPASGNLVALPFDLKTLSPAGPPVPVLANVSTLVATSSDGGTLVTGGELGSEITSARATSLAVVTFPSGAAPLDFEPAIYGSFEISPDGKKVAAEIRDVDTAYLGQGSVTGSMGIWVLDLDRGTKIRLTSEGLGRAPTWSADGDSVIYILDSKTNTVGAGLVIQPADGSAGVRKLGFDVGAQILDVDISPDGSHAALVLGDSETGVTRLIVRDIRTGDTVDLSGRLDSNIRRPRFSPDGRYIAYQSGASLLIRSADGSDVPVQTGQAGVPRWSAEGTAIYSMANGVVFKANVSLVPRFSFRPPATPVVYGVGAFTYYDVFKDGRAGLFNLSSRGGGPTGSAPADTTVSVTVTVNWFETLKTTG